MENIDQVIFDHKTCLNWLALFPHRPPPYLISGTQDVNGRGYVFSCYMQVKPSFTVFTSGFRNCFSFKGPDIGSCVSFKIKALTYWMRAHTDVLQQGLRLLCKSVKTLSIVNSFLFLISIQKQSTGMSQGVLEGWKQVRKKGFRMKERVGD